MLAEWGILDLGNISGYGIGVMCFIAVISGRLLTRAHYNDVVAQRDKYEAAFFKQQEANLLKDQQNSQLLETAHAMKSFMESFPRAVKAEEEGR